MESAAWQGLTVRASDGRVVGVVVGVVADGPLAGHLQVEGAYTTSSRKAWLWNRIVVFAIPRQAVKRRERGSVVLNVTRRTVQAKWRVRVLPKQAA